MKSSIASFAVVALMCSSVAACEKPGQAEQEKEQAAVQQAAKARAEADDNAQKAESEAQGKVTAARADFEKARNDYRHQRQQDLADADKRISDLQVKQMKATGKEREKLDANLPALRARRETFARDLQHLDDATPASWDGARDSLDKEWDNLKAALDQAS